MNALLTVLFLMPDIAFRWVAGAHLKRQFLPQALAGIWERIRFHRTELKRSRPRHSLGVNLILRYMEWDVALYRTLQEHRLSKEQAGWLVEEIGWSIFSPIVAATYAASRLRSADLNTRVRWINEVMFRVMFTRPFKRHDRPSPDGMAFDIVVCPLANYFREKGVSELTRHAACSLDYRMAQLWGVKLIRAGTMAEGAARCDFQFKQIPVVITRC